MLSLRQAMFLLFALTLQAHAQTNPPPAAPQTGITVPATEMDKGCFLSNWSPPPNTGAPGVQALLKDVSITTRWADLPVATKDRLRELAEDRLAAFRSRWGGEAIERKLRILLHCPTPEMSSAIDEFYRIAYKAIVPKTFTLKDVRNADLASVLTEMYLGAYAIGRAGLTYPNATLPNRDWDGKSIFDSTLLPDRQAYGDWRRYFARIAVSLRRIDEASLGSTEKVLRRQVLFRARAGAAGSLFGDSFGGSDLETACELASLNGAVLMAYKGDKGRPVIFANDDEVLREVNAFYLHNTGLKWLDKGTVNSAINNRLCNGTTDEDIEKYVGPISDSEIAKGIKLLKAWWIERLADNPASQGKCTVYSEADRAIVWEAFSADQQFNSDGSSTMETYRTQVAAYAAGKQERYRAVARLALDKVFPDNTVLTLTQRGDVVAAIDKETAFGLMPTKVAEFLDAAQGAKDGSASRIWNEAIQRYVKRLGGGYGENDPVRVEDEATLRAMFDQVREWVSNRYRGYPIDVAAIFPLFDFKATTENNATTDNATGNIELGIGTERSRMEYYSLLLHEVRHAVTGAWRANAPDKAKVRADEGAAVEGSGVAVEELLLETFMRETFKDDLAFALYSLDFGIRDARFAGTTDATLRKYFRPGCSDSAEPDTIEFTKAVANEYGLTGKLADNVALRAHTGSQYFQYISGGLQVLEDIAYLQGQLDPATNIRLDPFVLFACNLNTPLRDPEYISELKACLRSKT